MSLFKKAAILPEGADSDAITTTPLPLRPETNPPPEGEPRSDRNDEEKADEEAATAAEAPAAASQAKRKVQRMSLFARAISIEESKAPAPTADAPPSDPEGDQAAKGSVTDMQIQELSDDEREESRGDGGEPDEEDDGGVDLGDGWVEYYDEGFKRPYFYNEYTDVTQWNDPFPPGSTPRSDQDDGLGGGAEAHTGTKEDDEEDARRETEDIEERQREEEAAVAAGKAFKAQEGRRQELGI